MPTLEWLDRPLVERLREHRYRFAQGMVFGLPVLGLQYIGPMLGGAESGRWIGLFQALLAGWVVYVGSTGMLIEGLVRRGRFIDLPAAVVVIAVYIVSLIGWVGIVLGGKGKVCAPAFHVAVLVLVVWTGLRWWWLQRRLGRA